MTSAAKVVRKPNPKLKRLAEEILKEHSLVERAKQASIEHAKRCGDKLIEAKEAVDHGDWLQWLKQHCPTLKERTARLYMQVARHWDELIAKSATRRSEIEPGPSLTPEPEGKHCRRDGRTNGRGSIPPACCATTGRCWESSAPAA